MARRKGPGRPTGSVRRSQVITTYGPGALIDLPHDSAIIGGLDLWPAPHVLERVDEPRLAARLGGLTGGAPPALHVPPAASDRPGDVSDGITSPRFPEWFLVQKEESSPDGDGSRRSRRLVHRQGLDNRRKHRSLAYGGQPVVATRFVRGCPRGHVDDIDWWSFVHRGPSLCRGELQLEERGAGGDLSNLFVRCSCGKWRGLHEAKEIDDQPLGTCSGARPWLGPNANEACDQPARLLIRTATNAWFPQILTVLSLPKRAEAIDDVVAGLWDDLEIVDEPVELRFPKRKTRVAAALHGYDDAEVFAAIERRKAGAPDDRPVKLAELDALLKAPEGYGDDVPVDQRFHARRLPEQAWKRAAGSFEDRVEAVVQVHRLREVSALTGFSRFEAPTPDILGEADTNVESAALALEPSWFPAVENQGEGLFLQLPADAVAEWLERREVRERCETLAAGHDRREEERPTSAKRRLFPGGAYVLLHTLSHLLIQSLALRCGYPAASLRERVYVDDEAERFGLLLYTASPDAEGTLGGLVQQARHIAEHLRHALRLGQLCSNDPICAHHRPDQSAEKRWLHGAACHGCTLVAETSCEMRNDYLDRGLVVPIIGGDAGFFDRVE
ncbi:MAG: DUF1998 domain-containing protein [Acidobacteria bacterium]|nr:DUF1998 domain-containing protein [Acidobacteriota bacterium]